MRDYIHIGPVPIDESCAQVGRANYRAQARIECRVFKEQLERKFPDGEFVVKSFPHEFGTYFEVVAYFEDEERIDFNFGTYEVDRDTKALRAREAAFEAEANTPTNWDKEAKAKLADLSDDYPFAFKVSE